MAQREPSVVANLAIGTLKVKVAMVAILGVLCYIIWLLKSCSAVVFGVIFSVLTKLDPNQSIFSVRERSI